MVPDPDEPKYACPVCDAAICEAKLFRCSRCIEVWYCSAKCQLKDWKSYEYECRMLKKLEDHIESYALANPAFPVDLDDRTHEFLSHHHSATTVATSTFFGLSNSFNPAPDLLRTHIMVLEFAYNPKSRDIFDLLVLEKCYLQSRTEFLLTPVGKFNREDLKRTVGRPPKNRIDDRALVVPLVKSKHKGGKLVLLPITSSIARQGEGMVRSYVSSMVLESLQWALKGPVCFHYLEACYRSSLREARWGFQPHALYDTFRADQIIIPPSFLPDSLKYPLHTPCRSTRSARLEYDKPVAASLHSIRFLVESALREIMATRYAETWAKMRSQASKLNIQQGQLGEAFIIESLVELSGQVSTSEQLMEFFDAKRIEAGLAILFTLVSETRIGYDEFEGIGVRMAISEIQQELLGYLSCLAGVFTERTLLQLEIARRSPSKRIPDVITDTPNSKSSSTNLDSPSVDPSLFERVKLLIARGELKGSVWKSRSTWRPLLTSVFESFHRSLEDVFLDFNDKAPHPVRDLLKYHPSPLSLFFQNHDSAPGLVRYAYTGGHEKAVELNVAAAIELGLDSAARKEMAVGVVWLDQLDVENSTITFNDRNSLAKAVQGLDKDLFPESAKTQKNREKKAKKLAKREDEIVAN